VAGSIAEMTKGTQVGRVFPLTLSAAMAYIPPRSFVGKRPPTSARGKSGPRFSHRFSRATLTRIVLTSWPFRSVTAV
jgi:hypothetical protein